MNITKDIASSYGINQDKIHTDKDPSQNSTSSSSGNNEVIENVLILQGDGSSGAFGCGVFRALSQNDVKIDIVAGTSIGGVNAAIIAGSKNEKQPGQLLEQFWLELADSFIDLDNIQVQNSLRKYLLLKKSRLYLRVAHRQSG